MITNTEPKYKGMIGNSRCETALENILMDLNEPKITHLVMSQFNDFKTGLIKLQKYLAKEDRSFCRRMLILWKHSRIEEWDRHEQMVPKAVFTHFKTCLGAEYKNVFHEVEGPDGNETN